jgi:hypothetical protein
MTPLPNPFMSESARPRKPAPTDRSSLPSGESDPLVTLDYVGAGSLSNADGRRFVLDVEAFCLAIEPAPLFLQRTRS